MPPSRNLSFRKGDDSHGIDTINNGSADIFNPELFDLPLLDREAIETHVQYLESLYFEPFQVDPLHIEGFHSDPPIMKSSAYVKSEKEEEETTISEEAWENRTTVDRTMNDAQLPRVRETGSEQEAPAYYNQSNKKEPGMLSKATHSIYRSLTRRSKAQRAPIPLSEYPSHHGTSDYERDTDWENGDYFIACTVKQLKELDRETINRTRVIKAYIGPVGSPAKLKIYESIVQGLAAREEEKNGKGKSDGNDEGEICEENSDREKNDEEDDDEERDDEEEEEEEYDDLEMMLNPNRDLIDMTPEQIANYEDFHPIEFNPQTLQDNLSQILGIQKYGIQILATSVPEMYHHVNNESDYYQMPLIESPEQIRSNHIQPNDVEEGQSSNKRKNKNRAKGKGKSKEEDDLEPNKHVFLPKQSQPPAQSMILYLAGLGFDIRVIGMVMGPMDSKFVYEWNSRWYKGVRIPEHWEMNEDIAGKIGMLVQADKHWWEEEFAPSGFRIPDQLRILQARMRVTRATFFVKKVVENYYSARFLGGKRAHEDVLQMDGRNAEERS